MYSKKDPYSFSKFFTLKKGDQDIGYLQVRYEVSSHENLSVDGPDAVKNADVSQYLVSCTQRILIANKNGMDFSPESDLSGYEDYPVLINASSKIETTDGLEFELIAYSPQTINTKIQTSQTMGSSEGAVKGTNYTNTIGHSASVTGSMNYSVSIGMTGDIPMASESMGFGLSVSGSSSESNARGVNQSNSSTANSGEGDQMSIKDWGAYAHVNLASKNPFWTFVQEYPWDALECRKTDVDENQKDTGNHEEEATGKNAKKVPVSIPEASKLRLYDKQVLYPPSHLSLFGANFVTKAVWLVSLDNQLNPALEISHTINLYNASHLLEENGGNTVVQVYMDPGATALKANDSTLSTLLDLVLMSLNPVGHTSNGAIIGFIPSKFTKLPRGGSGETSHRHFRIPATSNDMFIKDVTAYEADVSKESGFHATETSLDLLFTKSCPAAEIMVYFKITDTIHDYKLYMKHWKGKANGVQLKLTINENENNPISLYVDDLEAEGGQSNLSTIILRNLDYASVDYHDYLKLGLNSIHITMSPVDPDQVEGCMYQLRAISIEKA